LVGAAVKLTEVPAQMVVAVGVTTTAGVTVGLTVMVVAFDVAVVGEAHAALEVMMQVTIFPCARPVEV
jgi:hypothetical protein